MSLLGFAIGQAEHGRVPDALIRPAIRRMLRQRLTANAAARSDPDRDRNFTAAMAAQPIALVPDKANEQHYEVPAEFFAHVLGPHRKYSSCLYADSAGTLVAGTFVAGTLADAEALALAETAAHAGLSDGQDVLELGCGWGSLTLWMAAHYPASRITAVSNSASQRTYIERQAEARGLGNVQIITCDMNAFSHETTFDRIVSVEMFEHMSNWRDLLGRAHQWLRDDGCLFIHVFTHREVPYRFEEEGAGNWMGRYFFSGGIMPSRNLISCFSDIFSVAEQWDWSGRHYGQTAEHWLENLDASRATVMPILEATYGKQDAVIWFNRWRLFFLAVAELFAFNRGDEWGVSHYLLKKS
ncbi:MAG: cyclopropane-fatty-acyl-phospholipid synthase [Proteobacteria bacterium]|nr:cyclopropane-fatty-acyl-phospholipid synthase [Pseudomonadota bacterium]